VHGRLYGVVVSASMACGALLCVIAFVNLCWRRRLQKYQRYRSLVRESRRSFTDGLLTDKKLLKKDKKFIGLPGLCVFPCTTVGIRTALRTGTLPNHCCNGLLA
jgi:hypothetical protein